MTPEEINDLLDLLWFGNGRTPNIEAKRRNSIIVCTIFKKVLLSKNVNCYCGCKYKVPYPKAESIHIAFTLIIIILSSLEHNTKTSRLQQLLSCNMGIQSHYYSGIIS